MQQEGGGTGEGLIFQELLVGKAGGQVSHKRRDKTPPLVLGLRCLARRLASHQHNNTPHTQCEFPSNKGTEGKAILLGGVKGTLPSLFLF